MTVNVMAGVLSVAVAMSVGDGERDGWCIQSVDVAMTTGDGECDGRS